MVYNIIHNKIYLHFIMINFIVFHVWWLTFYPKVMTHPLIPVTGNISSRFSSKSHLRENLEEMFPLYCMHSDVYNKFKSVVTRCERYNHTKWNGDYQRFRLRMSWSGKHETAKTFTWLKAFKLHFVIILTIDINIICNELHIDKYIVNYIIYIVLFYFIFLKINISYISC